MVKRWNCSRTVSVLRGVPGAGETPALPMMDVNEMGPSTALAVGKYARARVRVAVAAPAGLPGFTRHLQSRAKESRPTRPPRPAPPAVCWATPHSATGSRCCSAGHHLRCIEIMNQSDRRVVLRQIKLLPLGGCRRWPAGGPVARRRNRALPGQLVVLVRPDG